MFNMQWPFPIHMDFRGQKMAEKLFQVIVTLFGIIGFIAGYMMQQFSMTIYSLLFGVVVSALLTLPPWPIYRNSPITWQKASDSTKSSTTKKSTSSAKSPKKDNQKPKVNKDQ